MGRKRKSTTKSTEAAELHKKKTKISKNTSGDGSSELKWKSMTIECAEGLNCEDFEGLVGIEELDEYEAVNNNVNVVRYSNQEDDEDSFDDDEEGGDFGTTIPDKKKKVEKKKKKSKVSSKSKIPPNAFKIEEDLVPEEDSNLDMSEWEELSVPSEIIQSLRELKMSKPTPIQRETIREAIVERRNIYGAAPTGSGKTLAFGIPLLTHILENRKRNDSANNGNTNSEESAVERRQNNEIVMQALILTPTRELAVQIKKHLDSVSSHCRSIRSALIVGGLAIQKQERILQKIRPDIVVATPGRLWEIVNSGTVSYLDRSALSKVRYLVIDEADRMIERAHFAELRQFIKLFSIENNNDEENKLSNENTTNNSLQQVFIFSATLTMEKKNTNKNKKRNKKSKNNGEDNEKDDEDLIQLLQLSRDENKLKICDLTEGGTRSTSDQLQESVINCMKSEKDLYLYYFVALNPGRTIVFCNSIHCIRRLINIFRFLQLNPLVVHSSMPQKRRLVNIEKFTNSDNSLLFATDIASRGLDIPNVNHVVHYQVPRSAEIYIHRSGRTARIQNQGLSLMLCDPREEAFFLKDFCKILNKTQLNQYPINHQIMNKLKQRIQLAQNCDLLEHQLRKASSNKNWFKQAAKACEIILNSDEESGDDAGSTDDEDIDDSTVANMDKVTNQRKLKVFQKQLNALLKQNLSYRRL